MREKLPENFEMDKYGLHFRLVNEDDAEFILQLRTDSVLSRYIHKTENDVEKQKAYIRAYKEKEKAGTEYYFIVEKNGEPYGTSRISNINEKSWNEESWVFRRSSDFTIAILARLAVESLGFEFADLLYGSGAKGNIPVLNYVKQYNPLIIGEDEECYYVQITKENFEKVKRRFLRIFHIKEEIPGG